MGIWFLVFIGILVAVNAPVALYGLYRLYQESTLKERLNEYKKENKRLRGKTASASILNIWDLAHMESRVLFDVSIDNEEITGKRIYPQVWRKSKGNLWEKIIQRQEKLFETVTLDYDGPKNPNRCLTGIGTRKLMVAGIRNENGTAKVTPLLDGEDIETIRSGKEMWKLLSKTLADMGERNIEFVNEIIHRWRRVDDAMEGGLEDVLELAGELAARNDDALELFVTGWKKQQKQAGKYKGSKLNVETMGKVLSKMEERDISPMDAKEKLKEIGML